MTKLFTTALIALSALTGIAASANADDFGNSKMMQSGQHTSSAFGDIEKSGV